MPDDDGILDDVTAELGRQQETALADRRTARARRDWVAWAEAEARYVEATRKLALVCIPRIQAKLAKVRLDAVVVPRRRVA